MRLSEFRSIFEKVRVIEYPNRVLKDPLVSICIQTYQHAHFIRECLDGILSQNTNFGFEILLGEDGSTDATRDICLEYAKNHEDRIRLFLHDRKNNIQINGRPTGRFNTLNNIFCARGNYIAFCEGDDLWIDPLKLQKQIDFLEENGDFAGVGCYNERLEYSDSRPHLIKSSNELVKRVYRFSDLYKKSIGGTKTCTMVYRRSGPLQDFPDWAFGLLSGDRVIAASMLKDVGKICILPFVGAIYRVHSGGLWSSLSKKQIRANLQINYETISRHIFDTYREKLFYFWLHFKKTFKHDVASLNIRYIFRSFITVFQ